MPLIVSCTAVLTSLSHSVNYITFLFSKWRIAANIFTVSNVFMLKLGIMAEVVCVNQLQNCICIDHNAGITGKLREN